MRREGYIIEEIADYSNMSESFNQVLRGTSSVNEAARDATCLRIGRKCIKELAERISDRLFPCAAVIVNGLSGNMERQAEFADSYDV